MMKVQVEEDEEILAGEEDGGEGKKYYADQYRCCPPPFFIISVTLLELGFFVYYWAEALSETEDDNTTSVDWSPDGPASPLASVGPVPVDSCLIYRPDRRHEVWRFLTYMVLHASWWHLIFNLLVQLAVGLPLETVHGSFRVLAIYLAGVLAASLGTSVCDTGHQVYLVGASGGVYSLLAAHIANVLLNYRHMEFGAVRVLLVMLIAGFDVGCAVYHRLSSTPSVSPAVSYVSHVAGALAGLLIGLAVLRTFDFKQLYRRERWCVRSLALVTYLTCVLYGVVHNIIQSSAQPRWEQFL